MQKQKKHPAENQINDLIFKELLKRGYSLEGNTRVWNIADSKLWYLTPEQAQAYLDVEDSKEYKSKIVDAESELVTANLGEIIDKMGGEPINIIDLGCGDGKKGAFIVENFVKKGLKIRYCPIDISGYMVQKAFQTISKINVQEVIDSQYNISDFENLENLTPLLRSGEYKKSLFLLLGYTLGNFEIHEILYSIRAAMESGDILVIIDGIGSNKWEERAKTAKYDKKIDNFFIKTPLQLGLQENDLEFGARFKNSRIEFYYTLLRDKIILFNNREIRFCVGDQIIVAVAYKHDKEDLMSFLHMYFSEVTMKISKDKSTAMALCKK